MRPVEIPGITLHHLATQWSERAAGSFIQSLRCVGDDKFVLKVKSRTYHMEWLIQFPSIIIESGRRWETVEEQPGFIKRTKNWIENAKIVEIRQHGMDRILIFECTEGKLIIELFGDGNLITMNQQDTIVDVLHPKEWRTRTLRKGEHYSFPPGPDSWEDLPENPPVRGKSKSLGGWLATQLGVPAPWTRTVCALLQRSPEDAGEVTPSEWKTIQKTLEKWYGSPPTRWDWISHGEKDWILPRVKGIVNADSKIEEDGKENVWEMVEEKLSKEIIVREESMDKREKERNALHINRERQAKQKEEWEMEARERQRAGEWIYEHFEWVGQLLTALTEARRKKLGNQETMERISGKTKEVKAIDLKKGMVELETVE